MLISSPGPNDVIFGRCADAWNHQGNRSFRTIVAAYQDNYHSPGHSRFDKMSVVMQVIDAMKKRGSRFLRKHVQSNKWEVIDDEKSWVQKVGHAIRDRRSILKRKIMIREQKKASQDAKRQESEIAKLLELRRQEQAPLARSNTVHTTGQQLATNQPFKPYFAHAKFNFSPSTDQNLIIINVQGRRQVKTDAINELVDKKELADNEAKALNEELNAVRCRHRVLLEDDGLRSAIANRRIFAGYVNGNMPATAHQGGFASSVSALHEGSLLHRELHMRSTYPFGIHALGQISMNNPHQLLLNRATPTNRNPLLLHSPIFGLQQLAVHHHEEQLR